jgi:TolB-like protein/tetratricopeptide (TPR) repeat protein
MQAPGLDSKSASLPSISREEVEAQLSTVLAGSGFRNSQRRSSLLRWLVCHALDRNAQPVKEYEIGVAVFEKPESWDPQTDSAVRVEVNRVRGKLREYYENEGQQDEIRIDFPARGYVLAFHRRPAAIPPVDAVDPIALPEPAPPESVPARRRVSLRWIAMAAIALLAVFAVGARFLPGRSAPPLTSVAILPFLDLSPNHQDEYLSDGFTDELTNTLALLQGLRVVARTSAFQFKGKSVDVRDIGRQLGVGAVVEGSVLRSGNDIRVVAQLNRTSDGMHLWAATYDREVKDLLRVQDEIAQSIAESLRVELTSSGPGGAPGQSFDPGQEAHDLYLRGVYEDRKTTPASLRLATGYLEKAIGLAPRYAVAYGQLGATYINRASFTALNQTGELRKARRYLEDAVALDPTLGWAEGQLAYLNYVLNWDWRGAEPQFQHALATPEAGSGSRSAWGVALMTRGRFAESQEQFAEAIARDPLNLPLRSNFAVTLAEEGRFADADEQLDFCFRRAPDWSPAHLVAVYNAITARRPSEVLAHLEKAGQAANPRLEIFKASAWIEEGRRAEGLALLDRFEDHPVEPGVVLYNLALAYALAGDTGRMFRWLEQSADAREQQILRIKVNPLLARYRAIRA